MTAAHSEDLDLVLRLLAALRPDRDGPFGAPLYEAPGVGVPSAMGGLARVRVQTSIVVPTTPPGAFRREGPKSAGTIAAERVDAIARDSPEAGATLRWLQRTAHLDGPAELGKLYRDAALALAGAKRVERWSVLVLAERRAVQGAWGKARVEAAAGAWWSDEAIKPAPPAAIVGHPHGPPDPPSAPVDLADEHLKSVVGLSVIDEPPLPPTGLSNAGDGGRNRPH